MAYCSKCGKQVEDNIAFCPECGNPMNTQNSTAEQQPQGQTPPIVETFNPTDISENKILACLSYLGILFLIPMLAKPNSAFCKFHVNQGLILFIAELILSVVACIPILGWIITGVGGVVLFVFAIMGIVYALQGKAKELPLIGKFRIIK